MAARQLHDATSGIRNDRGPGSGEHLLAWAFALERVTGIEPALSIWEAHGTAHVTLADLRSRVSVSDRDYPLFTVANGPLMTRTQVHG